MTTLPSSNLAAGVQHLRTCAMAQGFASGNSRQQSWQEPQPDGASLTPFLTPPAQRRQRQQVCYQLCTAGISGKAPRPACLRNTQVRQLGLCSLFGPESEAWQSSSVLCFRSDLTWHPTGPGGGKPRTLLPTQRRKGLVLFSWLWDTA